MNVSDVIAGVGAAVALVALVTSFVVSRKQAKLQQEQTRLTQEQTELQQRQTSENLAQDKSNAIHDLQLAMAKVAANPSGVGYILPEIQGLALRADALLRERGVKDYWFDYEILGYAFAQVWDMENARRCYDAAYERADSAPSRLYALRGRAEYRFTFGSIDEGEDDFKEALDLVAREWHAEPDIKAEQTVQLKTLQARLEAGVGSPRAATSLTEACTACTDLQTVWRKKRSAEWVVRTAMQMPGYNAARLALPPEVLHQAVAAVQSQMSRELLGASASAGLTAQTQNS